MEQPVDAQAREARWKALMVAAQDGDGQAYESLLGEILPEVRKLVRIRLRDAAAVEDVVQNTLLAIHRSRHTFRPERPFGPWMRAVARNAFLDFVRARGRRSDRELPLDGVAEPTDPALSAADALAEKRLSPDLERALAELPASQREAVELVQLEGLTVVEAAARAGVTVAALKVRAHRGYVALRARLAERSQ